MLGAPATGLQGSLRQATRAAAGGSKIVGSRSMHNADAESQGELINGRYQLLARIGAGGMGVVYRALDRLDRCRGRAQAYCAAAQRQQRPGSWEPAPPATDPIAQTQPGSPTAAGDPSTPQTHSDDAAEAALAGTRDRCPAARQARPSGHGLAHSPPMPFSATAAELPRTGRHRRRASGLAATAAALPIAARSPEPTAKPQPTQQRESPSPSMSAAPPCKDGPARQPATKAPSRCRSFPPNSASHWPTNSRTLASFRHPNIIGVLDYGFDAARNPYPMELLRESHTLLEATAHASLKDKIHVLLQPCRR